MNELANDAQAACTPPDLIRVTRAQLDIPGKFSYGFAVGAGTSFLLLHTLSDRVDLDGYVALRMTDLSLLDREFERKSFYLQALKLKGIQPSIPQGIELSSTRSLLASVEKSFPLVVIDRELRRPGECEIGRIRLTSDTAYALRLISPDGKWFPDDDHYRYSDVTRVGFGGEYENTLALVAGVKAG